MPNNVVDSPKEEKLWERAKEQAKNQGKGENYAYIMSIYKSMNPDRFKSASGLVDDLLQTATRHPKHARSLVAIMLEASGWVPGELRDTMTWAPGHIDRTDPTYGDIGSQVPPARDGFGNQLDADGNPSESIVRVGAEQAWAELARRVQDRNR